MRFQKIGIALMLFVCFGCEQKVTPEVATITKQELKTALKDGNIQLLDVRRPQEYALGHIEGATNANVLDSINFKKGTENLNKEKPVYIYCQAGKRSKKASEQLKAMGFSVIYDFSGGYRSWD